MVTTMIVSKPAENLFAKRQSVFQEDLFLYSCLLVARHLGLLVHLECGVARHVAVGQDSESERLGI